jgi:hypothetical protein
MLRPDPYDEGVVARLLEFFGDETPWQRRLWTTSTVLRVREACEAIAGSSNGAGLTPAAVRETCASARDAAKEDPGIGSEEERRRVAALLSAAALSGSIEHRQLQEVAEETDDAYLSRWAEVLRLEHSLGIEFTARQLASHLLDGGASPSSLHRWWTKRARRDDDDLTLADLVDRAAQELTKSQEYEVVVPIASLSNIEERPAGWLTDVEVNAWLRSNGFDLIPEQHGGIRLGLTARDARAAVDQATDIIETYRSRLIVGTRSSSMRLAGQICVAGTKRPFPPSRSRRVEVHTLYREQKVFAGVELGIVDSAIELLSHLDRGTPAAAVAGGWAAVETLLKGPGDDGAHLVAPRIASLVACSFSRAELTKLAWQRAKSANDQISSDIQALETNKERAAYLADMLRKGEAVALSSPGDIAAVTRMTKILATPKESIERLRSLAGDPLRRLYRQRNLVLHAGKTDAVALRSTLQVSAPLMGAAMDRIAHAWFAEGVEPLRLAAIADLRIARLGTAEALAVEALLH